MDAGSVRIDTPCPRSGSGRRTAALANLLYVHEALRRETRALAEATRQAGHAGLLDVHPLADLTEAWWREWEPEPANKL